MHVYNLTTLTQKKQIYCQKKREKQLLGLVIIKMGYVDTVRIKRRNVSSMCVSHPSSLLFFASQIRTCRVLNWKTVRQSTNATLDWCRTHRGCLEGRGGKHPLEPPDAPRPILANMWNKKFECWMQKVWHIGWREWRVLCCTYHEK